MRFPDVGVLALSFLGMVDTLYLSLSRQSGPIPCHVTEGCEDVLGSVYSEVAGIPISWLGFAFYLVPKQAHKQWTNGRFTAVELEE